MEILALDSDFAPVKYLRYTELQWDRKYYECGDFLIQILASDYDSSIAYVYTKDRPETGIINKIENKASVSGEFVELSGFFMEHILNDKIIYPIYNGYGPITTIAKEMVNTYKADIPKLVWGTGEGLGDAIAKQETGAQIGDALYDMLAIQEYSYRAEYNLNADAIKVNIFKGLDRTQSQTANNFVTFSRGFRNLSHPEITLDSSAYKNYAVVAGNGEGVDRITVTVDLSGGEYKKQIFVDLRNMKYDSDKQSLAEYKAELSEKGLEKLLDYVDVCNVEFNAIQTGFIYLKDYDIGDKCDIVLDHLGLSYEARLIEVCETIKGGVHRITLTFGDKIPTIYEKVRM